jgi:hypothetical protein
MQTSIIRKCEEGLIFSACDSIMKTITVFTIYTVLSGRLTVVFWPRSSVGRVKSAVKEFGTRDFDLAFSER